MDKEAEAKAQIMKCFVCEIGIGPSYLEKYPFAVGDKIVCGHCFNKLQKQGQLTLNDCFKTNKVRKLMRDGRVTTGEQDG